MPRKFAHTLLMAVILFTLTVTAHAATYEVGTGKLYPAIRNVPWNDLRPGDSVYIFWRAQPYREKILLSCRGTQARPIRIIGVPNEQGQLPVLDGQDASTSLQFSFAYTPMQDRGLIIISLNADQEWGYKPGYIQISNLELRNASVPFTYRDSLGRKRAYRDLAASIFVERGEHILVHGCIITGSGNGFFVASQGDEANTSRDITVENCAIYGNGNVGRDREHNIYTEATGVVFQYNYLGRPRAGSGGNNLKDRSSGTVVRYNWIEGGAHLLDLVEAQDSIDFALADPHYRETYVYGNVLIDGPGDAENLVHYGGDNGDTDTYRKGTLFFYHNTVVVQCDQTGPNGRWRTSVFDLPTNDETVKASNNIIFAQSFTPGASMSNCALATTSGQFFFDTNWIGLNWQMVADTYYPFEGNVSLLRRWSNVTNNPGFVNLADFDLTLNPDSLCVDKAVSLTTAEYSAYPVFMQFMAPNLGIPRPKRGAALDLGAFEVSLTSRQKKQPGSPFHPVKKR